MAQRVLAVIMLVFALLGVADGWRLQADERGQVLFDDIGPDRYLIGLGVLLAVLAVFLLAQTQKVGTDSGDAGEIRASAQTEVGATGILARVPPHALAVSALIAYAAALPWLGYVVSTLLFTVAAFRVAGVAGWLRSAALGVATTGFAYAIFARASGMPLPAGWLDRLIG